MRKFSLTRQRRDRLAAKDMQTWEALQERRCMVCWCSSGPVWKHHLCGAAGRRNLPANLLLICTRCHNHFHGERHAGKDGKLLPELLPGHLLWCKQEADPLHFDLNVILSLKHWQALPERWEVRPLPEAFLMERNR